MSYFDDTTNPAADFRHRVPTPTLKNIPFEEENLWENPTLLRYGQPVLGAIYEAMNSGEKVVAKTVKQPPAEKTRHKSMEDYYLLGRLFQYKHNHWH